MNFCVEPGSFKVMVGASSADIRLEGSFEIIQALFKKSLSQSDRDVSKLTRSIKSSTVGQGLPVRTNGHDLGSNTQTSYFGRVNLAPTNKMTALSVFRHNPKGKGLSCEVESEGLDGEHLMRSRQISQQRRKEILFLPSSFHLPLKCPAGGSFGSEWTCRIVFSASFHL